MTDDQCGRGDVLPLAQGRHDRPGEDAVEYGGNVFWLLTGRRARRAQQVVLRLWQAADQVGHAADQRGCEACGAQ
ncbi:MAG: hypothetical protein ABF296_11895, partial [Oceanococcaceae bacterium]